MDHHTVALTTAVATAAAHPGASVDDAVAVALAVVSALEARQSQRQADAEQAAAEAQTARERDEADRAHMRMAVLHALSKGDLERAAILSVFSRRPTRVRMVIAGLELEGAIITYRQDRRIWLRLSSGSPVPLTVTIEPAPRSVDAEAAWDLAEAAGVTAAAKDRADAERDDAGRR